MHFEYKILLLFVFVNYFFNLIFVNFCFFVNYIYFLYFLHSSYFSENDRYACIYLTFFA